MACPGTGTPGSVLALINTMRAAHGSPALTWDAGIAARAAAHAGQCAWGHSPDASRSGDGENINMSYGYSFPTANGLDSCAFATQSFYDEAAVRIDATCRCQLLPWLVANVPPLFRLLTPHPLSSSPLIASCCVQSYNFSYAGSGWGDHLEAGYTGGHPIILHFTQRE